MFYSSPGLQLFVYYKESNTLLLTRWSWWCPGHWNCGILPISNSKCCCVHLLWRKFSNLNKRVQVVSLVFGHLPRKGQPKGSPECKWKLTSSEHVTHANIHNYSCWEVFWTLPPPRHYLSQQFKCKYLELWIMENACVTPWRTLHPWSNEKIILWQINWSTVTTSDVILLQHLSDFW